MARREWSGLGERQQKRYIAAGRRQGLSESEVITLYESGQTLPPSWRGQGRAQRAGVSERTWRKLMTEARRAELQDRGEVLESLLSKGFSVEWILRRLELQQDSRREYRSDFRRALRRQFPKRDIGFDPGRSRYKKRNKVADIEIYYYH